MKENNAKISGILSIVSGSIGLLSFLIFVMMAVLMAFIPQMSGGYGSFRDSENVLLIMQIAYGVMGVFCLLLGILGVVGGIYALKRKYWGLALAAAIAGILLFFPTGIPAIIFIVMARKEFLPLEPGAAIV